MKEPSLSMLLQMEFLWLISFNPSTFLKSFTLFSHSTDQVMSYEITSKPLLAVQVTELVDGIFIGIFVNHTILDATSFWHFVNSWSEFPEVMNVYPNLLPFLITGFFMIRIAPFMYLFSRANNSTIGMFRHHLNKEFFTFQKKLLPNSKQRLMPRLVPTRSPSPSTFSSFYPISCSQ
ncbi:hypothetical protein LWI29_038350 [Acer saccharum]|uniref:Uncharacterized protein n=1 Tax=Acer saccharum TaxID=4024 RepID=A0AA39TKF5_ACESA|nr:hypothetical protein LWI29_038350 [Acer saccharum]